MIFHLDGGLGLGLGGGFGSGAPLSVSGLGGGFGRSPLAIVIPPFVLYLIIYGLFLSACFALAF